MTDKKKILIISSDAIGEKMAGPGIRYFQIASKISKYHNVTLLVPNNVAGIHEENFELMELNSASLKSIFHRFDILLIQGMTLFKFPFLKKFKGSIVIDLYDPTMLEMLEIRNSDNQYKVDLDIVLEQLKYGDYFICASEKQKDLWVGMLIAIGRITPQNYVKDKNLSSLIGIVPFGIEKIKPIAKANPFLKFSNIKETDKVLVWGGGIWDWLDPFTVIEAIKRISNKRDDIKMVFMGTKHPTQASIQMKAADEAIELAKKYNLENEKIFFNDWVPYNDRDQYLLYAFAGVSFHINHLETEYSFRTRILDYIWCQLPMILTEGDLLAEIVKDNECGITVREKDIASIEEAILHLADDEKLYCSIKENLSELKEKFYWENAVEDLLEYCREPQKNYTRIYEAPGTHFLLKGRYYFSKIPLIFSEKGREKIIKMIRKK